MDESRRGMAAEPLAGFRVHGVVPAAGRGERFGGDRPKQFLEVAELLTEPDAAFAESFTKMRAAAYRNASMAFVFARDEEARKRAFHALIKSDPQNAALLKELLAG